MKSGNFKLSSVFGLTLLSVVALVAVSLFSVEAFSSFGEALSEKSVAMIVARTLSPKLSLITVPKNNIYIWMSMFIDEFTSFIYFIQG